MKRSILILSLANSILIVAILCWLLVQFLSTDHTARIVYLDNAVVFSEFNLAKELGKQSIQQINPQKKIVDSLKNILTDKMGQTNNEQLQKVLVYEIEKLNNLSSTISNKTNQQVWSRLNAYAIEFGKEYKYEIVLGTMGNGNIMYAKDSVDVTAQFIEFANRKYEGN